MIESYCFEFLSKLCKILMCGFEEKAQKPDVLAKNGQKWRKTVKNGQTRIFLKIRLEYFLDSSRCSFVQKIIKIWCADLQIWCDGRTHGRTHAQKSVNPSRPQRLKPDRPKSYHTSNLDHFWALYQLFWHPDRRTDGPTEWSIELLSAAKNWP